MLELFTPAYSKSVRFIQVTDVHLTEHNAKYLKDFVDDINAKYSGIDFVVFTGDNLDKPEQKDLGIFLDIIKQLNVRPYVLVGNHDLYRNKNMSSEFYMGLVRKKIGVISQCKTKLRI